MAFGTGDLPLQMDVPALSTVATNSTDDAWLAVPVQSDWNQGTTTAADYIKNKPSIGSRSFNNSASHSTVTGTGATGFQVSSTRDASVSYSLSTSTTATIGGASTATVVLEIASTNSATAGDWVEIGRLSNGQTITLAIALQSVQTMSGNLHGLIPAGYYAKLRTITSGTASASYTSGQEVLL